MEKQIVKIEKNDLIVGTFDLSKGFGMRHRTLKDLIEKYKQEFQSLGEVRKGDFYSQDEENSSSTFCTKSAKSKRQKMGRPIEQFFINEEQYVFLGTLLPNSQQIVKFKLQLTKEFFRMRKVLIKLTVQKQNEEWHAKRAAGIIERRIETDAIKDFIEYAKSQGSQNANKYYMIISKMENASLLHLELINQKFENHRDMVDGFDLDALKMADKMVAQAIAEGMKMQMHYKDIYQLAKDRVEGFALAIGRTPMRLLKDKK